MAGPNMSRNQSLAGKSVQQGSYVVTYNEDGYATSAKKGTGGLAVSTPTNTTTTTAQGTNQISQDIKASSVSSGSASSYTPAGAGSDYYAGQKMSGSDQATLKSYGDGWIDADAKQKAALAEGNTELANYYQGLKDQFHADAETLRMSYGYKGGTDGSEYIDMMQQPLQNAQQNSGYDLTSYLRQIYANQLESQLAGLKVAYEKSMAGYDDQAERLPQQYDAARNSVAAQDALAKKAFDERAAASGLSSGAAGQAELARSSAYQRDIASLDQAQADALSDIALQKTNLQSQYENAIAQARAEGNAALANALYEELVRVQGLNREDEQLQAQREAEALELAMKYAAKGSSGNTTGTKTGGGNDKDDKKDTTSLSWSNVEDWYNKYGYAAAKNYIREHYKELGYTSQSMALAGWENYLVSKDDVEAAEKAKHLYEKYSVNPAPDTSQRDSSAYWSSVTSSNEQSGGKGYDNGSLTAAGQNLYYQLQSIPGLTSENKVAMIEDALDKKRIEDTDADWLLNYLGY